MTKNAITLFLAVFTVVSFSACSMQSSWQSTGSEIEEVESESEYSSTSSAYSENSTLKACDLTITSARDYSNNVAWVSTSSPEANSFDYLIDADGNVLIDCDEAFGGSLNSSNISNYCNDSAVLLMNLRAKKSSEVDHQLIDKEGKVIWSMVEDGRQYALDRYGADAFESIRVDDQFAEDGNHLSNFDYRGYLVVNIDVDTYDFTGTLSGVLDSKGNWVIEPLPLSDAKKVAGWQYHTYIMCNGNNLINYRTGEVLDVTDKGKAVNPYYFKFGGKEAGDIDLWEEYTAAHDGVRYKGRMLGEGGASGFLDANENKVLDIRSLFPRASTLDSNTVVGNIEFNDGYCLLTLSNSGGGKYLTAIDLNGNQLFEPIKYKEHGALLEGAFFYKGNEDGTGYYLTANGEMLGDISADEGMNFHNGRAWILNDGVYSCIDTNGRIVF